jgi:hypothetical protein
MRSRCRDVVAFNLSISFQDRSSRADPITSSAAISRLARALFSLCPRFALAARTRRFVVVLVIAARR